MPKLTTLTTDFPSKFLFFLGMVDLLRGFLHTFAINWAAATFAKLDLSAAGSDQLTLLGTFGISNFLTGMLFILISVKAKSLSNSVLGIIPLAYAIGFIGLRLSGVIGEAAFNGKYFMLVYLLSSFSVFLYFSFIKSSSNATTQPKV